MPQPGSRLWKRPLKWFWMPTSSATRALRGLAKTWAGVPVCRLVAGVEDHHPVGQPARFAEVVRDQHHGRRQRLAQRRQLAVERLPGRRVHGRERLVQQQHPGLARQRPRQRHALLLAAGQLGGAALLQPGQAQPLEQRADALAARGVGRAPRAPRFDSALRCGNSA